MLSLSGRQETPAGRPHVAWRQSEATRGRTGRGTMRLGQSGGEPGRPVLKGQLQTSQALGAPCRPRSATRENCSALEKEVPGGPRLLARSRQRQPTAPLAGKVLPVTHCEVACILDDRILGGYGFISLTQNSHPVIS